MRMSTDAKAAVGKYFETFVREAIARAAFERAAGGAGGGESGRGRGDGFLEVSEMGPSFSFWEGRGNEMGLILTWLWWVRLKIWRSWRRSFCWIFEKWVASGGGI